MELVPWSYKEVSQLIKAANGKKSIAEIVNYLNSRFHHGKIVRSYASIRHKIDGLNDAYNYKLKVSKAKYKKRAKSIVDNSDINNTKENITNFANMLGFNKFDIKNHYHRETLASHINGLRAYMVAQIPVSAYVGPSSII